MRCPKCQYISFDSSERCRNCGYEFSLSTDEPHVEVAIGRDEPRPGRVRDVSQTELRPPSHRASQDADPDIPTEPFAAGRRPLAVADLPLFTDRLATNHLADDQAPLISPPAAPRQPLSVRRTNPAPRPRLRNPLPEELSLDLTTDAEGSHPPVVAPPSAERDQPGAVAGVGRRAMAGVLDLIVLGPIEALVFYLTVRAAGLTPEEWRVLPLLPLVTFMLMLCVGYFALFTAAGGQSIGKMAARIRVVPAAEGAQRVSFGAALVRAVAVLGSLVALGSGFLPVLLSADRRAFHDRVAETRVVIA
jgi:uncharacterized RDD family membrane protein YckC